MVVAHSNGQWPSRIGKSSTNWVIFIQIPWPSGFVTLPGDTSNQIWPRDPGSKFLRPLDDPIDCCSLRGNPTTNPIVSPLQCEAPKISKLVYTSNVTLVLWYLYHELVTGANLNQLTSLVGPHIVEIARFKDDFEVKWMDRLGVEHFLFHINLPL